MRASISLITLIFLAGCATFGNQLEALRAQKPETGDFAHALAAEYLGYAESLLEEGHPLRADHFAQKGLDALAGKEVPPENSEKFATDRARLMAVLTADIKEIVPAKAARAQIMFDCELGGRAVCKEGFEQALGDLQPVADALAQGAGNRFYIGFAPGSSTLPDGAGAILDVVARRATGDYRIVLLPPQSGALMSKRLLNIQKGLIARGVNAGRIEVERPGKSKEVTLSSDKKKKDANSIALTIAIAARAGAK